MYSKLMVPVDLTHEGALDKAIQTAKDLAGLYKAEITYVAVTASTPGKIAHTPEEFQEKLDAWAEAHGGTGHMVVSHDPSIDIDDALLSAADEIGADLVVMASHVPNLADHLWPSHGGKLAGHAKTTVMVVRG